MLGVKNSRGGIEEVGKGKEGAGVKAGLKLSLTCPFERGFALLLFDCTIVNSSEPLKAGVEEEGAEGEEGEEVTAKRVGLVI